MNGTKVVANYTADIKDLKSIIYYNSGDIYIGDVVNVEPHGIGTMNYSFGTVYEGGFEDGILSGSATVTWLDGDVYTGLFSEGFKNGSGTWYYNSGEIKEVEFNMGVEVVVSNGEKPEQCAISSSLDEVTNYISNNNITEADLIISKLINSNEIKSLQQIRTYLYSVPYSVKRDLGLTYSAINSLDLINWFEYKNPNQTLEKLDVVVPLDTIDDLISDGLCDEEIDEYSFAIVEDKPIFPGCDDVSEEERYMCFQQGVMNHIRENFKYPLIPKLMGVSEKIFVKFVIDISGNIINALVVRGEDPYLKAEALYLINSIPKLQPAQQKGKPVPCSFTVPINFKLN